MNRRMRMAASMAACWLAVTVAGAAEPAQQKADAKAAAAQSKARDKATGKTADGKAAGKDAANNKVADKKEHDCVVTTGSRIRRDPAQVCAPGEQVYSADELTATGELDTSEALRKLDPRFQ